MDWNVWHKPWSDAADVIDWNGCAKVLNQLNRKLVKSGAVKEHDGISLKDFAEKLFVEAVENMENSGETEYYIDCGHVFVQVYGPDKNNENPEPFVRLVVYIESTMS